MDEMITITNNFLSENCEITVTQNKDSVDLSMMCRVGGEEGFMTSLSPKFASALGDTLGNAGYAIKSRDD